MPVNTICGMALDFLRLERERDLLAQEVDKSSLPHLERVANILRQTGILSTMTDQDDCGCNGGSS